MRYFLGGLGVIFWNLTPRVPEIHTLTLAYNHVIRFCRPNTWASQAESREPNTITRQRGDTEWFWYEHYYLKHESKLLLPQCAGLLNHLMTGIVQDRTNFITGGKELCADCEQFLSEKEHNNHNPSCQSQIYLTVPSLLSSVQRKTTTDLEPLKRFI